MPCGEMRSAKADEWQTNKEYAGNERIAPRQVGSEEALGGNRAESGFG